jgi:hypothetical protein
MSSSSHPWTDAQAYLPTHARMTSRPSVLSEANIVLRWWYEGRFRRFFSVVRITFSPSSPSNNVHHAHNQYPPNPYVCTFITTVLKGQMECCYLYRYWPNIRRERSPNPSRANGRPEVSVMRFHFSIFVIVSSCYPFILSLISSGIENYIH